MARWNEKPPLPIEDGDEVILWWTERHGRERHYLTERVRKTRTQLVTSRARFNLDGSQRGRDAWSTYYHIEPITNTDLLASLRLEASEHRTRQRCIELVDRLKPQHMNNEQRARLVELLEGFFNGTD